MDAYYSPTTEAAWGPDRLAEPLPSGTTGVIEELAAGASYDLRAFDVDGREYVVGNAVACFGGETLETTLDASDLWQGGDGGSGAGAPSGAGGTGVGGSSNAGGSSASSGVGGDGPAPP